MPSGTITPTASISPTYSITDTPTITATAVAPAVADTNVFRPGQGGKVTFSFRAPQPGRVKLRVYNLGAELVRSPFEADVPAGIWIQAVWDGRNDAGELAGSGVYFVIVRGAGLRASLKVVLLK